MGCVAKGWDMVKRKAAGKNDCGASLGTSPTAEFTVCLNMLSALFSAQLVAVDICLGSGASRPTLSLSPSPVNCYKILALSISYPHPTPGFLLLQTTIVSEITPQVLSDSWTRSVVCRPARGDFYSKCGVILVSFNSVDGISSWYKDLSA